MHLLFWVLYAEFRNIILFPATFNLPVFTKASMNAFVAAPKLRRSLRSCSRMELGSSWSEIKAQIVFVKYRRLDQCSYAEVTSPYPFLWNLFQRRNKDSPKSTQGKENIESELVGCVLQVIHVMPGIMVDISSGQEEPFALAFIYIIDCCQSCNPGLDTPLK